MGSCGCCGLRSQGQFSTEAKEVSLDQLDILLLCEEDVVMAEGGWKQVRLQRSDNVEAWEDVELSNVFSWYKARSGKWFYLH